MRYKQPKHIFFLSLHICYILFNTNTKVSINFGLEKSNVNIRIFIFPENLVQYRLGSCFHFFCKVVGFIYIVS